MNQSPQLEAFNRIPELGGMGFSQVPPPQECITIPVTMEPDCDEVRLSEFCKAFRHPRLMGTLYISEVDPRWWYLELDFAPMIFAGNDELLLMETLANLMPGGEA